MSIAAIEEVLWQEWDPIGINDVLEARGEYSSYVAGIYRLLQSGASDADLMSYLSGIETGTMGLDPRAPQSLQPLVMALRAAYQPNNGLQGRRADHDFLCFRFQCAPGAPEAGSLGRTSMFACK